MIIYLNLKKSQPQKVISSLTEIKIFNYDLTEVNVVVLIKLNSKTNSSDCVFQCVLQYSMWGILTLMYNI